MTNEKLLAEITSIRDLCPDDTTKRMLGVLVNNIRQDMAERAVTRQGGSSVLNAAKRILKNSKKKNPHNHTLQYSAIIDGFQYVCDGYRLVKLKDHLPLPELPKGENYLQVDKLCGDVVNCNENLELPDLGKLKSYVKAEKAVRRGQGLRGDALDVYFDFGEDQPLCRADYLIDIMEVIPNCTAKYIKGRTTGPMHFTNGIDEAILMPVKKHNHNNTKRTEV